MTRYYFTMLLVFSMFIGGCDAMFNKERSRNSFVSTDSSYIARSAYIEEIFFADEASGPDTLLYAKSFIEGTGDTIMKKAGLKIGTDLIKERTERIASWQLEYVKISAGNDRGMTYAGSSETKVHLSNYRISTMSGGKMSAGIQLVRNGDKYEVAADYLTIYTRVKDITSHFSNEFKAVIKSKSYINCRIIIFDGKVARVNEFEYYL